MEIRQPDKAVIILVCPIVLCRFRAGNKPAIMLDLTVIAINRPQEHLDRKRPGAFSPVPLITIQV